MKLASPSQKATPLWRIGYIVAVIFLFIMAAYSRFSLPLDSVADADLPGYLWPALSKLQGNAFVHVNGLNFIYPGMLLATLRTWPDFRAISVVQHLLGLVAGGLFLLSWNRLADFLPRSPMPRPLHQALGLTGAAVYLFSNTPILLELRIRVDAICMFLAALSTWLTLQFIYYRAISPREEKAIIYGVAALGAAFLTASMKPSFTLFALFLALPMLWLWVRSGKRLVFFAASAALILVIALPEKLLQRDDPTSRTFLPRTLFAVHAFIIRAQMERDLQTGAIGSYSREWLQSACDDLGAAMQHTDPVYKPFTTLGYHPDYLMKGKNALFSHWAVQLGGEKPLLRFLKYYYWRSLFHRPLDFGRKIARQLAIFYAPVCPAFAVKGNVPLYRNYIRSATVLSAPDVHGMIAGFEWGAAYAKRTTDLSATRVVIHEPDGVKVLNGLFARSYVPVLLVSVVLALSTLWRWRAGLEERWAAFIVLLLYLANFGNTLGISIVHTMEVERYSVVQFSAALFAQLWAVRWLSELLWRRFRSGNVAHDSDGLGIEHG